MSDLTPSTIHHPESFNQATTRPTTALPRQALAALAIALGLSAALIGLVLRGGFGLGLTLAINLAVAGLWLYPWIGSHNEPRLATSRRSYGLPVGLTATILILGSSFTVWGNVSLAVVNFLVLLVLLIVLALWTSRSSDHDWDQPLFWLEAALAVMVRPFASLSRLQGTIQQALGRGMDTSSVRESGQVTSKLHPLGAALLGILLALPVLLVAGSLLASADAVFGQVLDGFIQFWSQWSIRDRFIDLALTLLFFPFIFSFLESCRRRWQLFPARIIPATGSQAGTATAAMPLLTLPRLNPVTLIAFLASINVLYLVFAGIQITYLTGAFQFILPNSLTYAEYARSGFFELAGLSAINVGLIVLALKGSSREGLTGQILRVLSLLLLAGSLVQWASAQFRMQMYIAVYGLTLLRFYVTAFMLLLAVVFVFLAIKEFQPFFRLFKAAAIAAVLSLVLLNAVNPDIWIARHNLRHMQSQPDHPLDIGYFSELSPDALVILQEALPTLDPSLKTSAQSYLTGKHQWLIDNTAGESWQSYNFSEQQALKALARAQN